MQYPKTNQLELENNRGLQSDATKYDVLMDLPPPPMLYNCHRCDDVRHPPDFFPPPPPPPPFPPRDVSQASLPRSFAFRQQKHPILPRSHWFGSSRRYEVDSRRRRSFDRNLRTSRPPPPSSPPIYREDTFPVQNSCYNSSEPNPDLRDDRFNRDLLNCWVNRRSNDRFLDVGNGVRYRDGYYRGRELYEGLDDGFGDRANHRGCSPYHERHSYECRLDTDVNDRAAELYDRRDDRDFRLGGGIINEGFKLYSEGNDFERRLINDINDRRLCPGVNHRVQELNSNRDRLDYGNNNRVWEHGNGRFGYGMDDPVCDLHMKRGGRNMMSDCNINSYVGEFYNKMDDGYMRRDNYSGFRDHELYKDAHDDVRGLDCADFGRGYGQRLVFKENYDKRLRNPVCDGVSLESANARQRILDNGPSFRWGLWSGYRERETTQYNQKNVPRKSALHRVQLGKHWSRSRDRKGQHVPQKLIRTTGKKNCISNKNSSVPSSPLTQSREGVGINDALAFTCNSESLTTRNLNHVGENARGHELPEDVNLEGSGDDMSGKIWETRLLEKKKKAEHVDGTILKKENDGNESIDVEICTDNESRDPNLNSDAKMLNCDASYAFIGDVTDCDSVLLPEAGIPPERAEAIDDLGIIFTPTKRRKCCISASSALPGEIDGQRPKHSGADNLDNSPQAKATEVADCALDAFSGDVGHGDRVTNSQLIDIVHISNDNPGSAFNTEDHMGDMDLVTNSTSNAITSINRRPCPDHIFSLGNADAEEPAEAPIYNKSCESVGLSIPREITEASEIWDNKCYLDNYMDRSTSKSDLEVHQKLDIRVISDVEYENPSTKGFNSAQVSRPMVGVNTQESWSFRSTAIVDCSSTTFCTTSSNIIPDDYKGIRDTFLEAISDTIPPLPFQCSAGSKRKAEDTQIYGSDIDAVTDIIGTVNGAVDLTKDISTAMEVVNEGSCGVKDSDIDIDVDYPSSEHKKRKVLISESSPSLPLEDDLVAEGNCSKFDNMSECDTIESESTSECDTTYVKEEVSEEDVALVNKMADGSKHREHNNWAFIRNNLSLSGDANDVSTSNSVDELDTDYCPSSPEDLISHTDFSSSPNRTTLAFHPKGQIMRGRDSVLTGNTCTAHVKKASSLYPRSTTPISILDKAKLPPKLKAAGGNFNVKKNQLMSSVPNVFPGRHPPYNSKRNFQPSHVTKSRTWHRSDNSSAAVSGVKQQPSILPHSQTKKVIGAFGSSYIRKGNSLVRNPSESVPPPAKVHSLGSPINRSSPSTENVRKNQASASEISTYGSLPQLGIKRHISSDSTEETLQGSSRQPSNRCAYNLGDSVKGSIVCSNESRALASSQGTAKASTIAECRTSSLNKVIYVRKRSNQLIAASDTEDSSVYQVNRTPGSLSDGYYKRRKNQLVRASVQNHSTKENESLNVNTARPGPPALSGRSSVKRRNYFKMNRLSKLSLVWKLQDTKSSEKTNNLVRPKMVLPHLIPWKRATYRKYFMDALISRPNKSTPSVFSHNILLSRKRGAIYTRSTNGYSLRMSKVLSIGGSSLKWSKSLEKNSKKVKEDAAKSVAAAAETSNEEKIAPPVLLKSTNISRERTVRVGSERYKMDSSGRTLLRITEESPSLLPKTAKTVKKSHIIGSEEYIRIGNGNQLVRDPKRRTRVLAGERVRWSLRTARLRLARKSMYCQFFTRFGKCNKEDGRCPFIHDPSKIAVCTKFLAGACSNADCKLTHKVIPERMPDCSYFLKGSCSNENCPYRHVTVDPGSAVCESFLRGYCVDGNECRKKHTYVCPAFEETGACPQISTCKLHHPKRKTEKRPLGEQKTIVRGRYFDGGLTRLCDIGMETSENLSAKGKDDLALDHGKYPEYISLGMSDGEL